MRLNVLLPLAFFVAAGAAQAADVRAADLPRITNGGVGYKDQPPPGLRSAHDANVPGMQMSAMGGTGTTGGMEASSDTRVAGAGASGMSGMQSAQPMQATPAWAHRAWGTPD